MEAQARSAINTLSPSPSPSTTIACLQPPTTACPLSLFRSRSRSLSTADLGISAPAMSTLRHRRYPSAATLAVLTFLLLVFASATISVMRQAMTMAAGTNKSLRDDAAASNHRITHNSCPLAEPPAGRRLLAGPGSSPPTCKGKCGQCKPCKAERVPIYPGVGLQAEYYPEVWFCKCGNKLFKP